MRLYDQNSGSISTFRECVADGGVRVCATSSHPNAHAGSASRLADDGAAGRRGPTRRGAARSGGRVLAKSARSRGLTSNH